MTSSAKRPCVELRMDLATVLDQILDSDCSSGESDDDNGLSSGQNLTANC